MVNGAIPDFPDRDIVDIPHWAIRYRLHIIALQQDATADALNDVTEALAAASTGLEVIANELRAIAVQLGQ